MINPCYTTPPTYTSTGFLQQVEIAMKRPGRKSENRLLGTRDHLKHMLQWQWRVLECLHEARSLEKHVFHGIFPNILNSTGFVCIAKFLSFFWFSSLNWVWHHDTKALKEKYTGLYFEVLLGKTEGRLLRYFLSSWAQSMHSSTQNHQNYLLFLKIWDKLFRICHLIFVWVFIFQLSVLQFMSKVWDHLVFSH